MISSLIDCIIHVELASGQVIKGLLLSMDTSTGWAIIICIEYNEQLIPKYQGIAIKSDSITEWHVLPNEDWAEEFIFTSHRESQLFSSSTTLQQKHPNKKKSKSSFSNILKQSSTTIPLYSKTEKPKPTVDQLQDPIDPIAPSKYWLKRYQLFSKFDLGIQMDAQSWYSVTPQSVAEHIAERARCSVIIDACCGAGGNAIQFAFTCQHVLAVENNQERVQMALNNAQIYNVAAQIEFVLCDTLQYLSSLPGGFADVIFLSPPWGGMDYNRNGFDIEHDIQMQCNNNQTINGLQLLKLALKITPNVIYFLPRTLDINRFNDVIVDFPCVLLETHIVRGRETTCCAYFGPLFLT